MEKCYNENVCSFYENKTIHSPKKESNSNMEQDTQHSTVLRKKIAYLG